MSLACGKSPSQQAVLTPRRRGKRAAMPPLGPRKPLQLDGRMHSISLRAAGPALAIARSEREITVPLARIARVIVRGRVHWDSAAVALCLQHRVPIVFLDGSSTPVGAALPLVADTGTLDELMSAFVDRSDWQYRYDNWLRSQKLRMLLQWRDERARRGYPVSRAEWTDEVRRFVYLAEAEFAGARAGAAYALVLDVLLRAGTRTQYRAFGDTTLALAADIAAIVDRRMMLACGSMGRQLEGFEALAARAGAAASAEHEVFVLELLDRLRRCVADLLEPWP